MSTEQSLKDIVEHNKLPTTPEKAEINRQFMSDEISRFDFYCLASEYLRKVKQQKQLNSN